MPDKGAEGNRPVLGDCKSRKETNNTSHLSHLPNAINAKGEVLSGLSCFWARCRGEEDERNFLICGRDRISWSHWALLLEAKLGTGWEPAAQLCRAQLLNWYITVKVSKLFLFLFYQFNHNFPWQRLYGAGGTDTPAIGREMAAIGKISKEMKKSTESIWSSRNRDFLSNILLWAKILSAR